MTGTIPECEACRPDARKLTGEEIARYSREVAEWRVETVDEVPQLHRTYKVRNFAEALAFTNRVGASSRNARSAATATTSQGRSAQRCARIRTSSSSVRCATARRSGSR